MRTTAIASLVVALTAATARADYQDPDAGNGHLLDDMRASPNRVYGQLGFAFSQRELDQAITSYSGLVFGLAIQRGKWSMIGELQLGFVRAPEDDNPALSGFATEAAVYVRRDAVSSLFGDRTFVARIATWVDAGAGVELMWFDDSVYRPKVALGIGGGVEMFTRTFGLGFTVELRVEAAPAVRWDGGIAGRCGGACEMSFSKIDFNGMAVLGFPFRL
jgi:hypothetical protein